MTLAKEILVTKRDGTKELYDVSKIKKSIQMASEGLDVNPLELESKFIQFLKPGIKTRDIQLNVIQHAIQLASNLKRLYLQPASTETMMHYILYTTVI